jgi:hypothetical protein
MKSLIGKKSPTFYDEELRTLLSQVELMEKHMQKILEGWILIAEPRPPTMGSKGYEAVSKRAVGRKSDYQELGQRIKALGEEKLSSDVSSNIVKLGTAEHQLGQAENEFTSGLLKENMGPYHKFLEMELKELRKNLDTLLHYNNTLDANKSKLAKAQEAQVKNRNDPKAKDAETSAKAGIEDAQRNYNSQRVKIIGMLQNLLKEYHSNVDALKKLVQKQVDYHQHCLKAIQDAQKVIH